MSPSSRRLLSLLHPLNGLSLFESPSVVVQVRPAFSAQPHAGQCFRNAALGQHFHYCQNLKNKDNVVGFS